MTKNGNREPRVIHRTTQSREKTVDPNGVKNVYDAILGHVQRARYDTRNSRA